MFCKVIKTQNPNNYSGDINNLKIRVVSLLQNKSLVSLLVYCFLVYRNYKLLYSIEKGNLPKKKILKKKWGGSVILNFEGGAGKKGGADFFLGGGGAGTMEDTMMCFSMSFIKEHNVRFENAMVLIEFMFFC